MLSVIQKLRSLNGIDENEFDTVALTEKLYGKTIDGIEACYEEAVYYGGTVLRNAGIMADLLEEYLQTHATLCLVPNDFNTSDAELNKLISSSIELYNSGKKDAATEKIWDAFERLKTFYTDLDKKKSVEKLVDTASEGNESIRQMLDEEFHKLTTIGNSFRIRHHETDKADITSAVHYEFFYKRCIALISSIIHYLE